LGLMRRLGCVAARGRWRSGSMRSRTTGSRCRDAGGTGSWWCGRCWPMRLL